MPGILITFQLWNQDQWQRLHSPFDHRFPIEIRGPIHQVEGPKQHREHYSGHLVNLAHAVVSLFGVWGLGFSRFELYSRAIWNSRDGCVLCKVGCIIHTGRTGVVWFFGQSQRVLLLWGERNVLITLNGCCTFTEHKKKNKHTYTQNTKRAIKDGQCWWRVGINVLGQ